MPNYYPPASGGAGGGGTPDDNSVTSAKIVDGAIVNADVNASAAIAYSKLALTGSIVTGDITDATITGTDIASATVAVGNMTAASLERAFVLGKAGAIGATETDAADFPFCVPFNCTIVRMKATLASAATGAMIVQLRTAAQPITTAPAMGNVSSVLVTFANTNVLATATGFSTTLTEGDFLNFSCSTGSGTSLLVEVVVKLR